MTTTASTSTIKKKKRLLNPNKRQEVPKTETINDVQPKKKKKRKLNQPIYNDVNSDFNKVAITTNETSEPSSPATKSFHSKEQAPNSPPAAKRSIRASSEAIAKREKVKQISNSRSPTPSEEKLPGIKKKRKLNSQKIVVPTTITSDTLVFEETGNISYSEYLESSSSTIPHHQKNKLNIVIGVPSKNKRKLSTKPADKVPQPPSTQKIYDKLDLSHHSILPNSSYVAHLPQQKHKGSLTPTTSVSSINEDEQIEELQIEDLQIEDSQSEGMQDVVLFSMMDNQLEGYNSSESCSEFFDAASDFEENAQAAAQMNNNNGFWNSLFKSFSK